jgi:hypothetical protein
MEVMSGERLMMKNQSDIMGALRSGRCAVQLELYSLWRQRATSSAAIDPRRRAGDRKLTPPHRFDYPHLKTARLSLLRAPTPKMIFHFDPI